ncbi:porin family protein [Hymenobacter psychrophilus]|uniref:Outer membrane protein beta-barrel domain-containing protein n=1 Tax=Hymenobacter psychrophilus TaxID=651662 RepID=A0A1H3NPI3_9BACT|nr:porin family protein [Hymenobacter psychrophilus]SDY90325.1 Outer membrane protein beta-barrel domain-containing protein [Hymenobacter psychrophilus]
MKKSLLAAAALLATFAVSETKAQGIRLGLKGGANLSNLAGDLANKDGYDYKVGFHGGLMLNVGLIDDGFLSLQPEVLYSQKGYKYDTNQAFGLYKREGDVTYNYIDVPVLLKVKAGNLFFEAGPQYSYLLKVKDESTRSLNGTAVARTAAEKDLSNVNRNEFGYVAGLGVQTDMGLMLGVRYNGALTDFAKNNSYNNGELTNARNQVFQVSLGYLLPNR